MSDIVKLTAKDGSQVEFVNKDAAHGAIKDVYFAPDRSYVVAFYRKPLDVNGRDRLDKIVGTYRERIFNLEGGEYWKKIFCWPEKLVEHEGKLGIVVPAYQPQYFFGPGDLEGAEKEGKWFASAKNFNMQVPADEKGSLVNFLRICLQLSRGVRRLHAAGLAHSDLSYKNCLIDPKNGSACIIDVDGLVVPGMYPPDVFGTPDFMAPEVVQTQKLEDKSKRILPSRTTDLHALAVLVYLYLFHRHPLRGSKVWSTDDDEQELLEMGEKALFIENKDDPTNRYKISEASPKELPWRDTSKLPYDKVAGPYLTQLFEEAFITGLHTPTLRPTADAWEDAILKTTDLILPCSNKDCVKKFFIYNNSLHPVCPYCGTKYTMQVPVLDFYCSGRKGTFRAENRRAIVWSGQSLYEWHVDTTVTPNEKLPAEKSKRVGYFSFHNGHWMLVNESVQDMYNVSAKAQIPPGSAVVLTNGLQILLSRRPSGRLINVQIANQ